MNDPLYKMAPADEFWGAELAEEAESLFVALVQNDDERAMRKAREVFDALRRMGWLDESSPAPASPS
jgi:hypothetical protein